MVKGIIFILIFGLFVSRLIPKYNIFMETNMVQLFGHSFEGLAGIMVLIGVLVLGVIVLALGLRHIYYVFNNKSEN